MVRVPLGNAAMSQGDVTGAISLAGPVQKKLAKQVVEAQPVSAQVRLPEKQACSFNLCQSLSAARCIPRARRTVSPALRVPTAADPERVQAGQTSPPQENPSAPV